MTEPPSTEDEVTRRLAHFLDDLTAPLGDSATIDQVAHGPGMIQTDVTPRRESALAITWFDFGGELQISSRAPRWPLGTWAKPR